MIKPQFLFAAICLCLLAGLAGPAFGQPEIMAWGNLTGIRMDGHLMELNSSMCVVQPDWTGVFKTGREKQTNMYARNGKVETVRVRMRTPIEFRAKDGEWDISATEVVEETGPGTAKIDLEYTTPADANIAGAYFCMDLPAAQFSGSRAELIDPAPPAPSQVSLAPRGPRPERVRARQSRRHPFCHRAPPGGGDVQRAHRSGDSRRPPHRQFRYSGLFGGGIRQTGGGPAG